MSQRTCTMPDCAKPYRARGLCSTHYNESRYPDRHKRQVQLECAHCGTAVVKLASTGSARRPTCSNECRAALQFSESRSHKRLVGPIDAPPVVRSTVAPTNVLEPVKRAFTSGPCRHCGDQFVAAAMLGGPQPLYCSRGCAKAWSERARGQFWASASLRMRLYARDEWICQLCMEPVRKDLHYGDDWAPSLDHIIPRSQGGADSDGNLRLAHRWCNSIRGDDSHYNASDLAPAATL